MIHKIKALYDNGDGLSIRQISEQLALSRNTVCKYIKLGEDQIQELENDSSRSKLLDEYRSYIVYLLGEFPNLSAVKMARKLRAKYGEVPASDRSLRRYINQLRQQVSLAQKRYFEPIIDDVPGVQCQVDPGELRGVSVNGTECTIYFVVFVLSYSRQMYVGLSFKPLDTERFIQLHDEAFRFFGGVAEECVYDQTKLVVIAEQYRELELNQRFKQYATAAAFRIHACEGYDPQSKGKVEAGVKYVKQDCFYGERFESRQALEDHVQEWLAQVANRRIHGSTGQPPEQLFKRDEQSQLKPYLSPACIYRQNSLETRLVDKTGLISYQGNKYSVPMAWQQARVGVSEADEQLLINDIESTEIIAEHPLCWEKGRIIKNYNHYRDKDSQSSQLEAQIAAKLGDDLANALCQQLKNTEPKIYRHQLIALKKAFNDLQGADFALLNVLSQRQGMTAGKIKKHLEAERLARAKGRDSEDTSLSSAQRLNRVDLSAYEQLGRSSGQQVEHG